MKHALTFLLSLAPFLACTAVAVLANHFLPGYPSNVVIGIAMLGLVLFVGWRDQDWAGPWSWWYASVALVGIFYILSGVTGFLGFTVAHFVVSWVWFVTFLGAVALTLVIGVRWVIGLVLLRARMEALMRHHAEALVGQDEDLLARVRANPGACSAAERAEYISALVHADMTVYEMGRVSRG